jgi:hypothetical protein
VTACSGGASDEPAAGVTESVVQADAPSAEVTETTPAEPVSEPDDDSATVEVTVARALLDSDNEVTDDQIVAGAAEKGMTAVVNADGTVTYTMTKAQQRDLLANYAESLQQGIDEMVADTSNPITAVHHNDGYTEFTATVDPGGYSEWTSIYAVSLFLWGGVYQEFAGVAPSDADVLVRFVDADTGAELGGGTLKEWLAKVDAAG